MNVDCLSVTWLRAQDPLPSLHEVSPHQSRSQFADSLQYKQYAVDIFRRRTTRKPILENVVKGFL